LSKFLINNPLLTNQFCYRFYSPKLLEDHPSRLSPHMYNEISRTRNQYIRKLFPNTEERCILRNWFSQDLGTKIYPKPYFNHWINIEIEKSMGWKMSCIEIGEKKLDLWSNSWNKAWNKLWSQALGELIDSVSLKNLLDFSFEWRLWWA
jgi:hypothetical protein